MIACVVIAVGGGGVMEVRVPTGLVASYNVVVHGALLRCVMHEEDVPMLLAVLCLIAMRD
jgi:hypothetical protein